jgi:fructose-bisphosphate aldolase class II
LSLTNGIEMLRRARAEGYAIGAFDVVNWEFLQGVIQGAARMRAPVIVSLAEMHFDHVDLELFAPALLKAAELAPVPVSVHLDHGESLETVERALRAGFTSVMLDGSLLPYEENIRLTREAVRLARSFGAAVEAELGAVPGREFYAEGRDQAEGEPSGAERTGFLYTDPEQARDFVSRTGCDFLAVSVGTVDGLYKGEVHLDFDRLERIRKAVPVPLVLHGGSGLSAEDYRRLIAGGIAKINFYAELSHAAVRAVREAASDPKAAGILRFLAPVREAVQRVVEEKIEIWGSAGKAA